MRYDFSKISQKIWKLFFANEVKIRKPRGYGMMKKDEEYENVFGFHGKYKKDIFEEPISETQDESNQPLS